jgi:hypothetical protein
MEGNVGREIGRFQCQSDEGEVFIVIKHQEVESSPRLEGEGLPRKLPELRLGDGRVVTPLDAKTFYILDTDQIIRKID